MTDPYVRSHLLHVAAALRAARPVLTASQAARRTGSLDALDAYARAGRFPRPRGPVVPRVRRISPPRAFFGPGARAPIFEDDHGVRCAVGHLVALDAPDLAAKVRDTDNGVYLPELASPELDDWAHAHGFTRDELAWIQPGYCWEIETCDEVVIEAPAAYERQCAGPDVSLLGSSSWYAMCDVCDGPVNVWAYIGNSGSETATEITVTVGTCAEPESSGCEPQTVATMDGGTLAPGESKAVGPFELPPLDQLETGFWFEVQTPDDCWDGWDRIGDWDYGMSPGWVEPAECGGGCTDTGAGGEDTAAEVPDPSECGGCGGSSAVAIGGVLLGLGLWSRRGARATTAS